MNNNNDDYKKDIRFDKVVPPMPMSSRRPSRLLIFIFSILPGLSHMYLGLIKRGLFYLSALALMIFLTVNLAMALPLLTIFTGFAIAALYAVAFFEAFRIRREIVMGIDVKDAIPNLGHLGKNKALHMALIVILIVAIGINILSALAWYVWLILGFVVVAVVAITKTQGK